MLIYSIQCYVGAAFKIELLERLQLNCFAIGILQCKMVKIILIGLNWKLFGILLVSTAPKY